MNGISSRIARGILAALAECEPRGLSAAACTVYASGLCGCCMTEDITLRHLCHLERMGMARREADPVTGGDFKWRVTDAGRAHACPGS